MEVSLSDYSLKIKKKQDLAAIRRFPPDPAKAKEYVRNIEEYRYGFPLNEFEKISLKTFLRFNPEIIRTLFLAGKYHFGAVSRLSNFLNIPESTCWGYLTSGVTQIQAKRISSLIQLLKEYGLSKIPCSISEKTKKEFVNAGNIKHFIKHGIKCTSGKNPRRIVKTYVRICEHGEISFPELVKLSREPVKRITKIKYTERATGYLEELGLVKQHKKYSKKGGNFSRVFSPTQKLSPDEFAFIVKNYDKIHTEELHNLFNLKLDPKKRFEKFKEIEKNLFLSGFRQRVEPGSHEIAPETTAPYVPTFMPVKEIIEMAVKYVGLKFSKALRMYKAVSNGIKGFDIDIKEGRYVAIPKTPMSPKDLQETANSNNMFIKDGLKPYWPEKFSLDLYKKYSLTIQLLRRAHR